MKQGTDLLLMATGILAFSTLTYLALGGISASQASMISASIPSAILLFTFIFSVWVKGTKTGTIQ